MSKWEDVSDELQLIRCANGIKLIRAAPNSQSLYTGYSVKKILQLPFSVYFLNTQSELQKANRVLFEETSLSSEKDCLGKTAHRVTSTNYAAQLIRNDREVLMSKRGKIIEETGIRQDDFDIHALSIKVPWYDQNNKLVGIMGCSAILKLNSIAEFLTKMSELNFLNNFPHLRSHHPIPLYINLTLREREVLEYVLTGLPARKIGVLLNISQRTVEYHLENIKAKFNVYSKSELIEKCSIR